MKRETGQRGEELAAVYLQRRGYKIITRNYRSRWGEIDIICRKNGVLIFVEVRSKSGDRFGEPEESITPAKMEKIRKTAFAYLEKESEVSFREIRFDFIAVRGTPEGPRINHIKSAF
ncbi:MAG: YraN family protein [Candidatus Saccharibacteria bacterium]